MFAKSTLVFSHDETIAGLYHDVHHLGARDREIQLLRTALFILPSLTKVEKWFHVKRDWEYAFFWIMKLMDGLATLEVLQHGEIAGREVVQQALHHNPAFFRVVYHDLINGRKTEASVGAALNAINEYLNQHLFIFQPLLDYLAQAGGARSSSEISHHFKNQMNIGGLDVACEWLADAGVLHKVSSPLRLTPKSRVEVAEAAYFYQAD